MTKSMIKTPADVLNLYQLDITKETKYILEMEFGRLDIGKYKLVTELVSKDYVAKKTFHTNIGYDIDDSMNYGHILKINDDKCALRVFLKFASKSVFIYSHLETGHVLFTTKPIRDLIDGTKDSTVILWKHMFYCDDVENAFESIRQGKITLDLIDKYASISVNAPLFCTGDINIINSKTQYFIIKHDSFDEIKTSSRLRKKYTPKLINSGGYSTMIIDNNIVWSVIDNSCYYCRNDVLIYQSICIHPDNGRLFYKWHKYNMKDLKHASLLVSILEIEKKFEVQHKRLPLHLYKKQIGLEDIYVIYNMDSNLVKSTDRELASQAIVGHEWKANDGTNIEANLTRGALGFFISVSYGVNGILSNCVCKDINTAMFIYTNLLNRTVFNIYDIPSFGYHDVVSHKMRYIHPLKDSIINQIQSKRVKYINNEKKLASVATGPKQSVGTKLDQYLIDRLDAIAYHRGITKSELIRDILVAYLEGDEYK